MYNVSWIERPANREMTEQEAALRKTYLAAREVASHLLSAGSALKLLDSPDVTACAALARKALHKNDNERSSAIKAAEFEILSRQTNYISALIAFHEHHQRWQPMRAQLLSQLEAVALPEPETQSHSRWAQPIGFDLLLNCEAVATLIDCCDRTVAEATSPRYSRPTQKTAETGFQKVFADLAAEVGQSTWVFNARLSCLPRQGNDILSQLPVGRVSHTSVPAEFPHCSALEAAVQEFESAFNGTYSTCDEFKASTRGSFNDVQHSEALLQAMLDRSSMQVIEDRRNEELRLYGRKRTTVRRLVETAQGAFSHVAEVLSEAVVEAAAIEDEQLRLRAQNLCLFAARRLRENQRFMRECDKWVGAQDEHYRSVLEAFEQGHRQLVERLKSKRFQHSA